MASVSATHVGMRATKIVAVLGILLPYLAGLTQVDRFVSANGTASCVSNVLLVTRVRRRGAEGQNADHLVNNLAIRESLPTERR